MPKQYKHGAEVAEYERKRKAEYRARKREEDQGGSSGGSGDETINWMLE